MGLATLERIAMRSGRELGTLLACLLIPAITGAADRESASQPEMILVVGAAGAPQFESQFSDWADRWKAAATQAGMTLTEIGRVPEAAESDRDRLQAALGKAARPGSGEVWLVLIGHGTFDRRDARFNLRGPDLTASQLSEWLKHVDRPVAVINTASASAPFLSALAQPRRVVIVATKSGSEQNFARFGDFLSQSIVDVSADLDKDGRTSLWEAYLKAARRTAEFYATDGRLQTEHAMLDDNGDGQGARVDQFRGLIPIDPNPAAALDGAFAHQWHLLPDPADAKLPADFLKQRAALEFSVQQLREQKATLPESDYYQQLERLLIQLAELNESAAPAP